MSWEQTYKTSIMYQLGKNTDDQANGHAWKRDDIVYPDGYVPPDMFAHNIGFHNGPQCATCGYEYCQHCPTTIEKCPYEKTQKQVVDALSQAIKAKRNK